MTSEEILLACIAAIIAVIVATVYTPRQLVDNLAPWYVVIGTYSIIACIYFAGGIQ